MACRGRDNAIPAGVFFSAHTVWAMASAMAGTRHQLLLSWDV